MSQISLSEKYLQELRQNKEFQQYCQFFGDECTRLTEIAQRLEPIASDLRVSCHENVVRDELAVKCRHLHRGYYCPSPTLDLIIANSSRGKILKRPTSRSNPSFVYKFDAQGRLLWCHNRECNSLECLIYEENKVYGFTFGASSEFHTLTEEYYQNGKLAHFYVAHFPYPSYLCSSLTAEFFTYDALGLCATQYFTYHSPLSLMDDSVPVFSLSKYFSHPSCNCLVNWQFERQDGFLTGYRCLPIFNKEGSCEVNPLRFQRKA